MDELPTLLSTLELVGNKDVSRWDRRMVNRSGLSVSAVGSFVEKHWAALVCRSKRSLNRWLNSPLF